MTKKEFVERLAERADITKKSAAEFTDAFLDELTDVFEKGDEVNFIGFGKFTVKERAGRKGKNPKTGEEVDIPARKVPYFTPGKTIKELANK